MTEHNLKVKNPIRLRILDAAGVVVSENIIFNTLTYAAADIMIAALLRSGPAQVTHLYAQHGGQNADGTPSPLPDDLREVTRGDLVDSNGDRGGLWIPILAAPAVSSSDTQLYNGNQGTFYFRIPGTVPAAQVIGNFVAGTSKITALALAVAVNINDRSQDIIISVTNNFTPFQIVPNGQLAVDYPFLVTIPVPPS